MLRHTVIKTRSHRVSRILNIQFFKKHSLHENKPLCHEDNLSVFSKPGLNTLDKIPTENSLYLDLNEIYSISIYYLIHSYTYMYIVQFLIYIQAILKCVVKNSIYNKLYLHVYTIFKFHTDDPYKHVTCTQKIFN